MTTIAASILGQAGQALGAFIPRLGRALGLLLIGLLLTRLLAALLLRAMQAAGVDRLADRGRVTRVLETSGLGASLASLIACAIRIFLAIVVIFRRALARCWPSSPSLLPRRSESRWLCSSS